MPSNTQNRPVFGGFAPLNPHQGSALDPLGGLQRPSDPLLNFFRAYGANTFIFGERNSIFFHKNGH